MKTSTKSASVFSTQLATFEAQHTEDSRSNVARANRLFDTKVQNSLRSLRGELSGAPWMVKFHDRSAYVPHDDQIIPLRRATGQPANKAVITSRFQRKAA